VYPVWTDRRAAGNRLNTWVSPFLLADPTDPNPVTNLTAYSDYTTPTSMLLTWDDPTTLSNGDPIDTFVVDIYRSGILRGTVPKGAETFTDVGLTTYNQYTFDVYVRTVPNDSLSTVSTSNPWYAGGNPVPSVPTDVDVVGGPVSGTVSWTNPTTMIDGTPIHDLQYVYVYRNGVELDSVNQAVPTTNFVDTPPDGGFYTYRLKAKLSTGYMSAFSDSAMAYIGPAPNIATAPDTVTFALLTNQQDSAYYTIYNTGQDTLVITGIEGEEINPTMAPWVQEQKYTPDYPKGSYEPTYGSVIEGHGGPDPFGYRWIDSDEPGGPTFNWFDITSVGTQITTWLGNADDGRAKVLLPFAFTFYGNSYNHVWVGTNGFLSFADTLTTSYLTNAAIPSTALPNNIIAMMWDDLNATTGAVRYYHDAANGRFVLQYNVVRYGTTNSYVFQVLLYTSGKIVIQYQTMQGTRLNEATVGVENSTGTVGLQVVYNANYVHNNLAVQISRGVLWLSHTPDTGEIVPGDSMQVKATVDATGLVGGTYLAKALIGNNVPLLGPYPHPIFKMTVTGVPDISVIPDTLDYGQVFVTYPDTMTFRVTNTGSDVLHVTNITSTPSEFTIAGPTSFDLAIGAFQDVMVVFLSASTGTFSGSATVTSDGLSGPQTVVLQAEVVAFPNISVAPDSLVFALFTNEVDSSTYMIYNTGTGTLNISAIEAEELTSALSYPLFKQEQKVTPSYDKGEQEPVYDPIILGQGGPDPFGYRWIDSDEPGGPVFSWFDISSVGTTVTFSNQDDGYATVALPFAFSLYGIEYTSINIVTNGFLNFGTTSTAYSNGAIPSTAAPNNAIYAFWDDLNLTSGGNVKYYHDAANSRFVVQYTDVPPYSGTGTYTFQILLYSSGKIVYQYLNMSGVVNSATVGIEDAAGTVATQIAYNQAYIHNNLAVRISRGVTWLTQNPTSGVVTAGDSLQIKAYVDAAGLVGGVYRATARITSNDPDQGTLDKPLVRLTVTGVPDIGVNPTALDFGTDFINQTDTMAFTVLNTGTDVLHVSNMTNVLPQFDVLGSTSFDVPVGGSQDVQVVFSSSTVGTFADTVTITSDGISGTKKVALAGEAIAPPVIALSDTLLDGGTIQQGEEDSTDFWIYNDGLSDLTFTIDESETPLSSLGIVSGETRRVVVHTRKAPVVMLRRGGNEDGQIASAEVDRAPVSGVTPPSGVQPLAQFDLQFDYDAQAVTGANGNAAAIFFDNAAAGGPQFWTSRWASNILHRWNADGTLIEQFTISGVTGVRGLTYDGQYLYGSSNSATIFIIDPVTKTLVGTITCQSGVTTRMITYDPVRDGFWTSNFTGNISCVDRNGAVIATIPSALAAKYGSAYDSYTPGGPYLWVFDQTNVNGGTPQNIWQFDLNTLTQTGVSFDILTRVTTGGATPIAGGLFVAEGLVPGKATIGGLLQGVPDRLFGLELAPAGLPWVDASPIEGTIGAGDSARITVYWHGVLSTEVQLDGYFGISSNDPQTPVENVHLRLDVITGVEGPQADALPTKYALHPNFPNPFNPSTTIKYDLKEAGKVSLKIYNVLGQEVRTLVSGAHTAGFKSVVWDGRNNAGQAVSSGIYVYRLETSGFVKSRKMMLIK
jgi:hypothetical protein